MSKSKLAVTIEGPSKDRRVGKRPSNAFEPGNKNVFRPGQSGNISGRSKDARRLISKSLRAQLPDRAPDEVAQKIGLSRGASWAMVIARVLLIRASTGNIEACREIRESVEGSRSHSSLQMIDENGEALKIPDLTVIFEGTHKPNFMDKTVPALPLPPLPCKIVD